MFDGENSFDQPIKNDLKYLMFEKLIQVKEMIKQTSGCLLDYPHSKENFKLILTDLRKQQTLDAKLKTIQQINFLVI